ncbi:MAG TPA: hypothetical protein VF251_13675 [Pyrinomonadaceae bacterium]
MEIKVKEMKTIEEITIRTRASDYRFRLIDPEQGRGILTGGRLTAEHEAVFVETIRPTPMLDQLEPGDRAVFLVGTTELRTITTSPITEIVISEADAANNEDC